MRSVNRDSIRSPASSSAEVGISISAGTAQHVEDQRPIDIHQLCECLLRERCFCADHSTGLPEFIYAFLQHFYFYWVVFFARLFRSSHCDFSGFVNYDSQKRVTIDSAVYLGVGCGFVEWVVGSSFVEFFSWSFNERFWIDAFYTRFQTIFIVFLCDQNFRKVLFFQTA